MTKLTHRDIKPAMRFLQRDFLIIASALSVLGLTACGPQGSSRSLVSSMAFDQLHPGSSQEEKERVEEERAIIDELPDREMSREEFIEYSNRVRERLEAKREAEAKRREAEEVKAPEAKAPSSPTPPAPPYSPATPEEAPQQPAPDTLLTEKKPTPASPKPSVIPPPPPNTTLPAESTRPHSPVRHPELRPEVRPSAPPSHEVMKELLERLGSKTPPSKKTPSSSGSTSAESRDARPLPPPPHSNTTVSDATRVGAPVFVKPAPPAAQTYPSPSPTPSKTPVKPTPTQSSTPKTVVEKAPSDPTPPSIPAPLADDFLGVDPEDEIASANYAGPKEVEFRPRTNGAFRLSETAAELALLPSKEYQALQKDVIGNTTRACNFFVITALVEAGIASTKALPLYTAAHFDEKYLAKPTNGWKQITLAELKQWMKEGRSFDSILQKDAPKGKSYGHISIPIGLNANEDLMVAEASLNRSSNRVRVYTHKDASNYRVFVRH